MHAVVFASGELSGATPELQRRLVFSLLRPVARLSALFDLPLKSLEELARLAYLEQLRRGGAASQAEIAEAMQMSVRTVASLEKRYRGDFLAPE